MLDNDRMFLRRCEVCWVCSNRSHMPALPIPGWTIVDEHRLGKVVADFNADGHPTPEFVNVPHFLGLLSGHRKFVNVPHFLALLSGHPKFVNVPHFLGLLSGHPPPFDNVPDLLGILLSEHLNPELTIRPLFLGLLSGQFTGMAFE